MGNGVFLWLNHNTHTNSQTHQWMEYQDLSVLVISISIKSFQPN